MLPPYPSSSFLPELELHTNYNFHHAPWVHYPILLHFKTIFPLMCFCLHISSVWYLCPFIFVFFVLVMQFPVLEFWLFIIDSNFLVTFFIFSLFNILTIILCSLFLKNPWIFRVFVLLIFLFFFFVFSYLVLSFCRSGN